jgi:hypothetical protein
LLAFAPGATAIACTLSVLLSGNGPAYFVEDVLGALPSVV